ncbi:unnamed protein product, partial [Oppiella nova]
YSIVTSRSPVLQKINVELSRLADQQLLTNKWILFEKAIEATATTKQINTKLHPEYDHFACFVVFIAAYRICLVQIYGYKQLIKQIQCLRSITYDPQSTAHQQ